MFNFLIILTAVINLANTQETPEPDGLAILRGLDSSNLDCSLRFDRKFIESNEDIAAAIEELLEAKPTRKPCEDGEECERRRDRKKGRRGDSEEEVDATEAPEDTVELRRILRENRGGRRGDRTKRRERGSDSEDTDALEDGQERKPRQTREPKDSTKEPCADGEDCRRKRYRRDDDSTKEPCDDDKATEAPTEDATDFELRRNLKRGKGRGRRGDATKKPRADGETKEPRQTREPKDGTKAPRQTREPKDGTKEPCADGEDCRQKRRPRRDDSFDDDEVEATEAPTEAESVLELRRNLGKGKRRESRPTREPCEDGEDCRRKRHRRKDDSTKEPLADGETRKPRQTREPKDGTKEPCEDGEDCRRKRHRRRDDSSDDDEAEATEAPTESEAEADLELRRNLKGGKGRDRRRKPTREPLADGETRKPRQTREPKDGTKEPCADGEDCRPKRRRRDDSSDDDEAEVTEAPTEAEAVLELRRNLKGGKGRGRRDATREPLADGETREPRQTREPKDGTKEPCADGEDCRQKRKRRRGDDSEKPCDKDETTEAPAEQVQLRRLLRREDADATDASRVPCEDDECERKQRRRGGKRKGGRRDADSTKEPRDKNSREPRDVTKEPCTGDECESRERGHRRRKDDATTESAEEESDIALRRALKKARRGRRGRSLDAVISNGNVEVAGITGTVVFGELDAELESIPLTLTIGETVFQCDVEVRGNGKVSCRGQSEDNFKVHIGCAIEADEETEEA